MNNAPQNNSFATTQVHRAKSRHPIFCGLHDYWYTLSEGSVTGFTPLKI